MLPYIFFGLTSGQKQGGGEGAVQQELFPCLSFEEVLIFID
jgi:hypothetical protein